MFSGFWGWFLVVVLVVAIFSADRLPELKNFIENKTKDSLDALKKGTKNVEDKLAKAKMEKKNKNNSPENGEE